MTSTWEIKSTARLRESTRQGFVRDAMVGEIELELELELELKNCREVLTLLIQPTEAALWSKQTDGDRSIPNSKAAI